MAKKKKSHYRWLLPLLGISCIVVSTCFFTSKKEPDKPQGKKRIVLAFLDSGINGQTEVLRDYPVRSIDFTGEGIEDNNGHGTAIAESGITEFKHRLSKEGPPNVRLLITVELLSIKILNRFLETDEVKLLRGLQAAIENGATEVNIAAGGIRKKPKDAIETCRKIIKIIRRNTDVLFFVAAGNEGLKLSAIEDIMIPQSCLLCPMPLQTLVDDTLEDVIYIAERGMLDKASKYMEYINSLLLKNLPAPISLETGLKFRFLIPDCMTMMKQYLTPTSIYNQKLLDDIQRRCGRIIDVKKVAENINNNLDHMPGAFDNLEPKPLYNFLVVTDYGGNTN